MRNGLVEFRNGDKVWYLNDLYHRVDGPAIEYISGTKYWYINNMIHRIDGPAIEFSNGEKMWYLNGEQIHCNTNEEFFRLIKLKAFW